jgi:hypothetical protein
VAYNSESAKCSLQAAAWQQHKQACLRIKVAQAAGVLQ